ncbi:B12-binding domain-containing radical SAM protein [Patescibacteria group bacterium]|nr:B12-binding domain-containing radical SAM protein [Patescibacteria group bacterium]
MKVLLINPARTYYSGSKGVRLGLPLGIMYIAANLKKNGINVEIFDTLIDEKTKILEKDDHTFHGVEQDYFIDKVKKYDPDIVGVTSQFTAQIENTTKAINLVRQAKPKATIMAGGPHFAVLGRKYLEENKNLDYAVVGEGEYAMLDFVNSVNHNQPIENIAGLIYRRDGEIKQNDCKTIEDLDNLPVPAYELIDMQRYFSFLQEGLATRPGKFERSISMITSRGCPFNCVFCSIHLHMGKMWRKHSAEYTVSHIDHVVKEYEVKHISFEDDNFTFNPQRCENILDGIQNNHIKITWDTPNGVRADTLNETLLKKMKGTGCEELVIGTESGDQETLDKIINKNLKLTTIKQVAEWCKKIGIKLRSFYVIGFPGETKEKIQNTIDFAFNLYKKYNVTPSLMVATPLYGTRLHDIVIQNDYLLEPLTPKNLALGTQARGKGLIKTKEFSPQDLKGFSKQLESRVARYDLSKRIFSPKKYLKMLKLFIQKPTRLIAYIKRLKG